MSRVDLEALCTAVAVPVVHASALLRAAWKDLSPEPWTSAKQLPKRLQAKCAETFEPLGDTCRVLETQESAYDLSVKFRVGLRDGLEIETVLMPESRRMTLCVSSQVGCAQACSFCHTGRMGLVRNLTAGEIAAQWWLAARWIAENHEWAKRVRQVQTRPEDLRISNVVFMGMGEPLDNVPAVAAAIGVLTDVCGPALALRRISVSTAGHLDGLAALLAVHPEARIALSVHSTDDAERSRIMPINRRWPLADVFARMRELCARQEHHVLLQYTLIRGVNDDLRHAHALVALCSGLRAKVNLIPFNVVGPSRFASPGADTVAAFRDVIHAAGIRVMVRYSKGQDIAAACGQLVRSRQGS